MPNRALIALLLRHCSFGPALNRDCHGGPYADESIVCGCAGIERIGQAAPAEAAELQQGEVEIPTRQCATNTADGGKRRMTPVPARLAGTFCHWPATAARL